MPEGVLYASSGHLGNIGMDVFSVAIMGFHDDAKG